jgi:hypothetical protein
MQEPKPGQKSQSAGPYYCSWKSLISFPVSIRGASSFDWSVYLAKTKRTEEDGAKSGAPVRFGHNGSAQRP